MMMKRRKKCLKLCSYLQVGLNRWIQRNWSCRQLDVRRVRQRRYRHRQHQQSVHRGGCMPESQRDQQSRRILLVLRWILGSEYRRLKHRSHHRVRWSGKLVPEHWLLRLQSLVVQSIDLETQSWPMRSIVYNGAIMRRRGEEERKKRLLLLSPSGCWSLTQGHKKPVTLSGSWVTETCLLVFFYFSSWNTLFSFELKRARAVCNEIAMNFGSQNWTSRFHLVFLVLRDCVWLDCHKKKLTQKIEREQQKTRNKID